MGFGVDDLLLLCSLFLIAAVSSLGLFLAFIKQLTEVGSWGTLGLPYLHASLRGCCGTPGNCEFSWNKSKETTLIWRACRGRGSFKHMNSSGNLLRRWYVP